MGKIRPQITAIANGKFPFKLKILLIAVLPIIAIASLTGWLIHIGANRLIEAETNLIEERVLAYRQQELKNYISIALSAIDHEYSGKSDSKLDAQKSVQQILHNLNFGDDGYFFVYDRKGTGLVNPPAPELVGSNLWYVKDTAGNFIVQELMQKAVNGGGFFTYHWNKPSTDTETLKLGYATYLPKWGWMLGTGLYLDDIEREVAILKAEMHRETRKAETFLFFATLLAVLVTAIAIAAVNYSEHRLADAKLKALTRRIVDVQEDERKRVSNDLHDGINQLLVSVRHRLELAIEQFSSPDKAVPLLHKSVAILDTSIADVRRLSKALHPSALDNIGLAVAVRELGRDFEESTRIETTVSANPTKDRLSDSGKIALYRVLQEALTNVARHASASKVDILLEIDEESKSVLLKIADDGIGLKKDDGTTRNEGLGLRNMQERMESHGGSLLLRNGEQGGLELLARLPQT